MDRSDDAIESNNLKTKIKKRIPQTTTTRTAGGGDRGICIYMCIYVQTLYMCIYV